MVEKEICASAALKPELLNALEGWVYDRASSIGSPVTVSSYADAIDSLVDEIAKIKKGYYQDSKLNRTLVFFGLDVYDPAARPHRKSGLAHALYSKHNP
ncbi:MAG: hypothetical protein R3F07_14650 [Opitutaceae bacterium]